MVYVLLVLLLLVWLFLLVVVGMACYIETTKNATNYVAVVGLVCLSSFSLDVVCFVVSFLIWVFVWGCVLLGWGVICLLLCVLFCVCRGVCFVCVVVGVVVGCC